MQTRYRSARTSLLIFDIMTWIAVFAFSLIAVRLFATGSLIPSILLAVGTWLFGVFEFAFTQFARAQIDTADNTRQILNILSAKQPGAGDKSNNSSSTSGTRREPTLS